MSMFPSIPGVMPNQRSWVSLQNWNYQKDHSDDMVGYRYDKSGDYAWGSGMAGLGADVAQAVAPPASPASPAANGFINIPGGQILTADQTLTAFGRAVLGAAGVGYAACKFGILPTAIGTAALLWFLKNKGNG